MRLSRDEVGHLTGVIERVRTGEKVRFDALDVLVEVIRRMMASDPPSREATENAPPRQAPGPGSRRLRRGSPS